MDHDSVPLELAGPISHKVADVREAYAKITRHSLEIMGERIANDPNYRSNEDGHFAWDVSLLIRAACITWRVTGNPSHLKQAVTWSQHIIDRTDEARKLKNWRGKTGAAWSAGARYTAGHAKVSEYSGMPIYIQAAAETIVIERPRVDTAIVRAIRSDGGEWVSPEASLLPNADNYLPDVLARYSTVYSVLVRGLPAPIDLRPLPAGLFKIEAQFAAHFVHTGMIARALMAAAEELEFAAPGIINSDIKPEDIFEAAGRALQLHDDDMRVTDGQPWYITPEDFPGRRLGLDLPHNQVVDAATSFMILGHHQENKNLCMLGDSLARRFITEIEEYLERGLPHPWYYYPVDSELFAGVVRDIPLAERQVPAVARTEDSSHATMRARALLDWKCINDKILPDDIMSAVALSFRRHFMTKYKSAATIRWLADGDKNNARLGQANTYSGAWIGFSAWDSSIKRRMNAMAYRHPPRSIFGATALSSAEIFAANSHGQLKSANRRYRN